jgi:hypothetical protein
MDATAEAIANVHGQTAAIVPVLKFLIETHPERDRLIEWLGKSIVMIEQMSAVTQAEVMMSDEQAQPVTPMLIKQNQASLAILRMLAGK